MRKNAEGCILINKNFTGLIFFSPTFTVMIEIVSKTKNYAVVYKPPLIPTQADQSCDTDAMTLVSEALVSLGESGDLWLVHRLDRVVGGLLVFARNKDYAAKLSALVGGNGMTKEYFAIVEGACEGGVLRDFLYKDSKQSKAFVVNGSRNGAKEAELEYSKLAEKQTERGARTLVRIKLHTGRFHQIRAQFASRKLPLVGDGKYGSRDNRAKIPALFAMRLSFSIGSDTCDEIKIPNIDEYPWNIFERESYL